jgi:hypothetical protein
MACVDQVEQEETERTMETDGSGELMSYSHKDLGL